MLDFQVPSLKVTWTASNKAKMLTHASGSKLKLSNTAEESTWRARTVENYDVTLVYKKVGPWAATTAQLEIAGGEDNSKQDSATLNCTRASSGAPCFRKHVM